MSAPRLGGKCKNYEGIVVNRLQFIKRVLILGLLFLFLVTVETNTALAFSAYNGDLLLPPKPIWPPLGQKVIIPITRDTWLSSAGEEKFGSNGRAKRLKLKGQLEYALVNFDLSALINKRIMGALLHIRSDTPKKAPLTRIGVSSVASKWVEGTSKRYRRQIGSSCFAQAEYKKRDWAYPGSTLMDVVFGRGHTIWKFAECTAPDADGWQVCAVDPDVIAARVAGLSHGFCLFDEVGYIWSQKKGRFEYRHFPNRMSYSKESRRSAPWMEVWTKGEDRLPPAPVKFINIFTDGLPPGEALISWKTPEDNGGGKVLGFEVRYISQQDDFEFPRYLIPMAAEAGAEVRMHIQDLPFASGEIISLIIRAVDNAGNVGAEFSQDIWGQIGVKA